MTEDGSLERAVAEFTAAEEALRELAAEAHRLSAATATVESAERSLAAAGQSLSDGGASLRELILELTAVAAAVRVATERMQRVRPDLIEARLESMQSQVDSRLESMQSHVDAVRVPLDRSRELVETLQQTTETHQAQAVAQLRRLPVATLAAVTAAVLSLICLIVLLVR
jgi:chromosome segregation ATPase